MKIESIIWLEEIVEKLWRKHHVREHEVEETLENHPKIKFGEKGHRPDEHLYVALGQTDSGRYLAVFFIFKESREALVVSARDMTPAERRRYEQR